MLPLVLLLNVSGTVSFEDRTETRARLVQSPVLNNFNQPTINPNDPAAYQSDRTMVLDLETDPTARIRFQRQTGALTLAYAPRIVLANFTGGGAGQGGELGLDLIHRPMLTFEKAFSRRTVFLTNGMLQIGTASTNTLLLPQRWDGEARPEVPRALPILPFARQTFVSIYAASGFYHQFSPTLSGQASLFYITFGQPTQRGRIDSGGTTYLQNPGVSGELNWQATRHDGFTFFMAPQVNMVQASPLRLDGTGQVVLDSQGNPTYANGYLPSTYQLLFEVRWRRQLAKLTHSELSAGGNVLQSSTPRAQIPRFDPATGAQIAPDIIDDPFRFYDNRASNNNRFNFLPVGEALISQGFFSGRTQGRLIAYSRADAWLNTVSGAISARSATVGALNLDFGLDALRAQIAFVQSLPFSTTTTFFRQGLAELAYERQIGRHWFFDVGARAAIQQAAILNANALPAGGVVPVASMLQPGAFVGLSWRPEPAKF